MVGVPGDFRIETGMCVFQNDAFFGFFEEEFGVEFLRNRDHEFLDLMYQWNMGERGRGKITPKHVLATE